MEFKFDLDEFLREICIKFKNLYKNNLSRIILFGSYARGDFKTESDIDIMILVNLNERQIEDLEDYKYDILEELSYKYPVYISVMVYNIDYFNKWKNNMPLFKNVVKDGIYLNG